MKKFFEKPYDGLERDMSNTEIHIKLYEQWMEELARWRDNPTGVF